uniref:Uncharacterized protein n=1 Tax=Neogobius melanostomus TaxID=47308 RepID=A0A8C6UM95_9GOBI
MLAVLNGHTQCVSGLLRAGASVDVQDMWGHTALHRGAAAGEEECVRLLLQRGASVCLRDTQGRSALHLAAACGRASVLRALLRAPSPLQETDNQGFTPLHWACYSGYDSCVEMLLRQDTSRTMKGSSFSPLHCAVINNHERVAQMLLMGFVVNRAPLHAAVFSDHVECVRLLLRFGALVNHTDTQQHRSPLMMAALRGHTNSVEVLLKSVSTDLSLQDVEGNTSLHLACSKGLETCALLILEKISDRNLINCTNRALQTALHLAAQRGLTVVVQELLLKGATVSAVDRNGYCPALACAPSREVANCLALILRSMCTVSGWKGPVCVSSQDLNDSDSETY